MCLTNLWTWPKEISKWNAKGANLLLVAAYDKMWEGEMNEQFDFQAEFRENICYLGLDGLENKTLSLSQTLLPPRVLKVINGLRMLPTKCDLSQDRSKGVAVRPILRSHSSGWRGPAHIQEMCGPECDFCLTEYVIT